MDLDKPSQKPPELEGSNGLADEHSGQDPPPIPPVTAVLQPPAPPEGNGKPQKEQRGWLDYTKIGFEIAGVVAVIAYTTFAALQWCAMNKAARAAKQSADAATCAAKVAAQAYQDSKTSFQQTLVQMQGQTAAQKREADAAISASRTTEEALTSVQRAFVSFSGVVTSTKTIVGNRTTELVLSLPWINEGSTPTRNAISRVNWVALPIELPSNFGFADIETVQDRQFVIAPRNVAYGTESVPISFIDEARQGQAHLYVWGWMVYHDVFKGTPARLNEFCEELTDIKSSVNDISDPSANITWELSLCTVPHNCSDEECLDYKQKTKDR